MSFICPQCDAPTLEMIRSLELPGDSFSDEITLQQIACYRCGLRGTSVYQESRRGQLDSESWDHTGYRLDEGDYQRLDHLIQACPNPADKDCVCTAHIFFNLVGPTGQWQGLSRFRLSPSFILELA